MPFCSIYRYYTLGASTLKYSLPNRYTRNCSTPNTKIDLGVEKGPHPPPNKNIEIIADLEGTGRGPLSKIQLTHECTQDSGLGSG